MTGRHMCIVYFQQTRTWHPCITSWNQQPGKWPHSLSKVCLAFLICIKIIKFSNPGGQSPWHPTFFSWHYLWESHFFPVFSLISKEMFWARCQWDHSLMSRTTECSVCALPCQKVADVAFLLGPGINCIVLGKPKYDPHWVTILTNIMMLQLQPYISTSCVLSSYCVCVASFTYTVFQSFL